MLTRIRRKSTSSLASLKSRSHSQIFAISDDAPPVPSIQTRSVFTASRAAKPAARVQPKVAVQRDLPDAVLVRIFALLTLAPTSATSTIAALGGPAPPVALPSTGKSGNGPGTRALGRCTLVSRRFNRLASPVLYTDMTFDDGYRHDPFLDMQSGAARSAKYRFIKLLSSAPSDAAATRKAALLAQTRTLTVAYHWQTWCNARPPIPRLPALEVLRINLDAQSRDNGLHVDRKCAAKACRMMDKVRAPTVVFHGVSLWSVKSAWEHLPPALGQKAERVVYIISSARPPSRGVKGEDGERGVPLHIARQPLQKGERTPVKGVEVVLVFEAPWAMEFELGCDTKEPNGISEELKDWGWVGGLVNELANTVKQRQAVKRLVLVNADSLPIPPAPGQSRSETMAQTLHGKLGTGQAVGYRTMRQYMRNEMRNGEMDAAIVQAFLARPESQWRQPVEAASSKSEIRRARDAAGPCGLEVWYKEESVDGKTRGVRFG